MGLPENTIRDNAIDGNPLASYGVIALRGSCNDFVKLPSLKEPSLYSWPGEDNDDVDLTNRKVKSSDISLTLLMSGTSVSDLFTKRGELFGVLKADGWHDLYICMFNTTYQVYYKGCDSSEFIRGSKFRIKMVLKFSLNN